MIGIDCLAPDLQVPRLAPACWEVDPEVFYGPADSAEGGPVHTWERRALTVCAGCPVLATCRAEALEFAADEQFGVIGGMTAGQRRAVLRGSRPGQGRARPTRRRGRDAFPLPSRTEVVDGRLGGELRFRRGSIGVLDSPGRKPRRKS